MRLVCWFSCGATSAVATKLALEAFPEVFDRMAKLERKLNAAINKSYAGDGLRKEVFLDELDPDAGRGYVEPMDCGLFCQEDAA